MDRSKIVARFSLLPRRHKAAAACVAAAIAVGGFFVSMTAPRLYESTAVLSYDTAEMHALDGAEHASGERSAAHLVTAILNEGADAGSTPQSHLAVSEDQGANQGSRVRVRWVGAEPMETMVAAQTGAQLLTTWSPSAEALIPARSDGAKAASDGLATASVAEKSANRAPVRQSSEEMLLRATLSVLDMQLKGLQEELHRTDKSGRGWMKSASLALGAKADDRSQIEKKISNLHRQQALIQARLKEETEREAASVSGPDRRVGEFVASVNAMRAVVKPVEESHPAMAPHPLFVLAGPVGTAHAVSDWRSKAGGVGLTLALLGGALYLSFALWRFRPVHGSLVLRELLPKEVIFVGCTPERHE